MQKSVEQIPGVRAANLNFASGLLLLEYDPAHDPRHDVVAVVKQSGHGIAPAEGRPGAVAAAPAAEVSGWTANRAEIAVTAGAVLIAIAWLLSRLAVPEGLVGAFYAASIIVSGTVTWRRTAVALRARTVDMNVLMSIAVVGAVLIGEWSEASAVIWLFALGGLLESRSLSRTRRSIRELVDLAPTTALVLTEEGPQERGVETVAVGDVVVVRPGARIALDGVVAAGVSSVDESPITGESLPVDKVVGDRVFAGSLNTSGVLDVAVSAVAEDSTLARIVYLVEEAQGSRAPVQRLVDRFTRWYTPMVVGLSALVAIAPPVYAALTGGTVDFGAWFYRGLVVLVVSCPCALVISTPVAVVSAISRAARDGILVKGGAFIEQAAGVRAVAFDKTGTLTRGAPEVAAVESVGDIDADHLLSIAGALEVHSNHPIARSIVKAAGSRIHPGGLSEYTDTPGLGVQGHLVGVSYQIGSAQSLRDHAEEAHGGDGCEALGPAREAVERQEDAGRTALVLSEEGCPIGVIGVADAMRTEVPAVMDALRGSGMRHLVLLSGDNERTAGAVALAAGLEDVRARLLPEEKTEAVAELREHYGAVAMVGDGVNDAPALAAADIGIAMGAAGSDTALETADVALMADDLLALPRFFELGRRTIRVITENIGFSIGVKAVTLVLAVVGIAPLWLAVFADMGVSLIVILNSMRLLRA